MSSENLVILIGRMGKDPEMRQTQSGKSVVNFSMATSYKPKNGDEQTEWHNVVAWDKLADIIHKYMKKGSQLYIKGKLQTRKWQDKDGNDRYTTEIVANDMVMMGSKDGGNSTPTQSDSRTEQPMEDIPF